MHRFELIFQFGSYLSQNLMDFASIWLIVILKTKKPIFGTMVLTTVRILEPVTIWELRDRSGQDRDRCKPWYLHYPSDQSPELTRCLKLGMLYSWFADQRQLSKKWAIRNMRHLISTVSQTANAASWPGPSWSWCTWRRRGQTCWRPRTRARWISAGWRGWDK